MSFQKDLERMLFYFGFRKCKKRKNLNFMRLKDNEYLVFRIFEKNETVDLIHAKFETDDNPCDSEPYWENALKQSFTPDADCQILRDFIEKYTSR